MVGFALSFTLLGAPPCPERFIAKFRTASADSPVRASKRSTLIAIGSTAIPPSGGTLTSSITFPLVMRISSMKRSQRKRFMEAFSAFGFLTSTFKTKYRGRSPFIASMEMLLASGKLRSLNWSTPLISTPARVRSSMFLRRNSHLAKVFISLACFITEQDTIIRPMMLMTISLNAEVFIIFTFLKIIAIQR